MSYKAVIKFDENITIRNALHLINENAKKILYVIDDDEKLVGVVSDGDIRRWILTNGALDVSITNVTNYSPKSLSIGEEYKAFDFMVENSIDSVALVNGDNKLVDIIIWSEIHSKKSSMKHFISNPVVIMAGGEGKRLFPYTNILPKTINTYR